MTYQIITTDKAPAAIGSYSQAVSYGDLLFVSGQIGLDPATGEFVADDFALQTQRIFDNLSAILQQAGITLHNVIKLNVSVISMDHFAIFNDIMTNYFDKPYPARAVVGVRELPKGALVEVEVIAGMGDAK